MKVSSNLRRRCRGTACMHGTARMGWPASSHQRVLPMRALACKPRWRKKGAPLTSRPGAPGYGQRPGVQVLLLIDPIAQLRLRLLLGLLLLICSRLQARNLSAHDADGRP